MSKQKIEFRNFWHIIEPEKINYAVELITEPIDSFRMYNSHYL